MAQTEISVWLNFALQQMTAESYLSGIDITSDTQVRPRLLRGNNAPGFDPPVNYTRFTEQQADRFLTSYDIIDHHANDATGFSATLMREIGTNNFTLSFRSTEFKNQVDGGDWERDGQPGADGEIFFNGFAVGQLVSMEKYYQQLKADGGLPQGAMLSVTGYSLGGHLATIFTELHANEVQQTYTFNSAGRGDLAGGTPGLSDGARIAEMLEYFSDQLVAQGVDNQPFASGATGSLYTDSRYQAARQALFSEYQLTSRALSDIPRSDGAFAKITQLVGHATHGDTEYVANSGVHAAETSVFIEDQPNFDGFGGFLGLNGDFGTTHSITLIVDSLATQELFQTVAPMLAQAEIEAILSASSNQIASGFVGTAGIAEGNSLENALDALGKLVVPNYTATESGRQTGDFGSLTFRNPFHANLETLKTALAGQTYRIEPFLTVPGSGTPGPVLAIPADVLQSRASENSDRGLAYRYALQNLSPFAVMGNTSESHTALYAAHTSNGTLDLYNETDGTGTLTTQYLTDRALFLAEKVALNQLDQDTSSRTIHFQDVASSYEIKTPLTLAFAQREFLFGSDDLDTLTGGGKDDHLYGGESVDVLIGNGGRDYLEGNGGSDRLEGGAGADTMVGGAGNDTYVVDDPGDQVIEVGDNGTTDTVESSVTFSLAGTTVEHLTLTGGADLNGTGNDLANTLTGNSGINRLEGQGGTDHLIGGLGNDILAGGTGNNDLLEGGAGFDTYLYNAGDGNDQIEDSDATGRIVFNGKILQGGVSTDGGATYQSLDGSTTYVLSGGHLIVNGVLTVNADFQSGQFGISLTDLSSYPTNTGVPTGPFALIFDGGPESNQFFRNPAIAGPLAAYGNGGDDLVVSGGSLSGGNLADGGADDDMVVAGSTLADYLIGGDGEDYLYTNSTGDVALGGDGNDVVYHLGFSDFTTVTRHPGRIYADGGAGHDLLLGGLESDVLRGGTGDDTLRGENIPTAGWFARVSSGAVPPAWILVQQPEEVFSATGGADFLDGGDGNDLLVGDGGDDILSGEAGNDRLFGDDEAGYRVVPGDDMLDGGAGDDLLAGGDGADSLSGGTGVDQLFGDKGIDILDGGDGVDTLHGGDGADELYGGAGADQLFGDGLNNLLALSAAGGADFLDGGAGNDHLEGGTGDDTLFGGTEDDVLFGDEGADSLFGDEGADELQGGDGNDLLSGDAGDDRLFGQADNDTLYGDEGNDQLAGNDSTDTLVGGAGHDVLEGGTGNDTLIGGTGQDTYLFSLGDGQDTITDMARAGEGNVIQFGTGVTLQSLTFIQDQAQQTLTIQVAGGDSIQLLGFNPNTFNYVVDSLSFADGTQVALAVQLPLPGGVIEGTDDNNVIRTGSTDDTIFAGAGNDVVTAGAGNDVLVGGAGTDTLQGGAGQDTYVFNLGDGTDIVSDGPGEGNRVVFGPGVSASSVTLGLGTGDSLSVRTGLAGDAIQILANLENGESPSIDVVEFADGTTLSIEELLAQGIEITGTTGADTLTGTSLIDRISGGAGNDVIFGGLGADILHGDGGDDQLFGGDGDDQLDGGTGTDVLNGEAGQDTYVFGRGYGQDIVRDAPVEQSGPNAIQLTSGVSPDEVRLQARQSEDGIDVVLTIDGTQDELTLLGAADPILMPISQMFFPDGTSWDTAEILNRIEGVRLTASASGSFLEGTAFRDELIGAQGNDQLDGLGGPDRMVGGAGDDLYRVDHSGDVVVEAVGEGQDTVFSQIDYTLPDNVESLFLRSTALPTTDPVRGEGNASANLLVGNFVNNVLIGGAGNDIFWGGFSIGSDYGPGDDELHGGTGSDTYFVEGDFNGFDTLHDVALPGEGNRLQFGNSVRPEDVVFVQVGSTLRVTNAGGEHGAVLADFDPSGLTGSLVTEVIAFSGGLEDVTGGYETHLLALMNPTLGTDNTDTMTGTSNAEVITALGGDDVIAGGGGNDVLLGGTGNDTYLFNQGDGFDLIDDQPGTGDTNTVQFGAGITQNMLRVSYNGTFGIGGLSVRIGASGEGVHFLGVSAEDPTVSHAIDTFQFADGTQLTFAELFEREILVQGTGRSDGELFGTFADDRMNGFGGSESLSGQAGNDILEGGTGNDLLSGGEGEDTYIFQLGDGFDRIEDDAEFIDDGQGGHLANNRILFGPGIFLSDLSFVDVDLTIRKILVGSNGDGIELPNFVDFSPGLRTIGFSDGLTVDIYDLRDGGQVTDDQTIQGGPTGGVLIGGAGNDFIQSGGGNTALIGGAGNDTLIGGSGPNMFYAGPGNDFLIGGNGGNTFLLSFGSGRDSIQIPNYLTSIETNTVQFGGAYDTYRPTLGVGSLVIRYGTAGDELHILDFDPNDVFAPPAIQTFRFTDRTLTYGELIALGFDIEGTAGNDVLSGTNTTDRMDGLDGNDTIESGQGVDTLGGGRGSDLLRGGAGDDTYRFNIGDEIDAIDDTASIGEGNRIQFGVGIVQSDLTVTHDQLARTLTIQVGSSGTDQLRLVNFDPTGANGSLVVETLAFADGSTTSLASLLGGPVNQPPTVANPLADQTVPEDAPFSFIVPANTFADEDAGDTLTLSASLADGTALPSWLSFDAATRTLSGTPDDAQVGTLNLRVTATDTGNLSVSDSFTLTVNNVNEAPTVAVPLADQQATEDAPFNFVVPTTTFADVDPGDVLTYSASLAGGGNLPTWLSFNPTTRTFTGTPLNGDVGPLGLTVTVTDSGNLNVSTSFTLTVQNVNDAPTVANPIVDQSAPTGAAFTFTVPTNTFADVDLGDTLTYSATLANGSALPAWLSFNSTTRVFSGTPNSGDAGVANIKVTATDTGSLSASDFFDLTVTSADLILTGTSGNDVLTGGAGNDQLFGLAGNDTLNGGQGHDLLDGGTGTDTMQGGTGNDTYIVDVSGDVVTELANEGTDTVQSAIAYTLGANVENLTLTGTANLNGTGNALDNFLTGNSGSNVLTGGAGNDTYLVGAGDSVAESLNSGTDTVQSAVTWTLGSNVENLTLIGTANINGTGSSANNVLIGNNGNNTLDSGSGNDTVDGGAGNDSLLGGSGDDQLLGGVGDDTLNAGSGNDLLNGGDGTDILDGGSGNDQLLGGAGNDTLTGGSGADQFTGGTGNDTMTGGSGNDLYNFSRGDGQDTISDSDPFTGNQDRALLGTTINPLDLVISRQANDLRVAIHGSSDQITVQNWYLSANNRIETLQAGNGQTLLSTQVDQLIQAMAGFTQQTGLTWDQGIDQRPQDVQTILAASWQ